MVGLSQELMNILKKRGYKLKGEDLKHLTEAILIAENSEKLDNMENKEENATVVNEKLMREWMLGGE